MDDIRYYGEDDYDKRDFNEDMIKKNRAVYTTWN